MKIPYNDKEVQQLTGCLIALSHFLSCVNDKTFQFFTMLKKNERFEWIDKCEHKAEGLISVTAYFDTPITCSLLYLYLSITDQTLSSILVQQINKIKRSVYSVSKVFKGSDVCSQKIERHVFVIMVITRNLRPYFKGHLILVQTDYPIRQVFKKPYRSEKNGFLGIRTI